MNLATLEAYLWLNKLSHTLFARSEELKMFEYEKEIGLDSKITKKRFAGEVVIVWCQVWLKNLSTIVFDGFRSFNHRKILTNGSWLYW